MLRDTTVTLLSIVSIVMLFMMVGGCHHRSVQHSVGTVSYILESGVDRNREHPNTFEIPSAEERENLKPGQLVKLMFRITHERKVDVERMWVIVQEKHSRYYVGKLDNDPYCTDQIKSGMRVRFEPQHVIQIWQD
jgi:hypothetical protein